MRYLSSMTICRICQASAATRQLFGIADKTVKGKDFSRLVSSAERDTGGCALRQTLHLPDGAIGLRCEVRGHCADGGALEAELRTRWIEHDGQRRLVAIVRNLAAEKRVQAELDRYVAQLTMMKESLQRHNAILEAQVSERTAELRVAAAIAEKANSAKSDFLAHMSHELRTPLHGILSFARFGVNKFQTADRGKLQTYFQRIEASGRTLLHLLNNILDLSKLEAGCVELLCEPVELASLVAGVVEEFSALVREKNVAMHSTADVGIFAWGDSESDGQVLRNIVGNAVKFTPENGVIRIEVSRNVAGAEISIQRYGSRHPGRRV